MKLKPVIHLTLIFFILTFSILSSTTHSCSANLDCGSNVRYKICDHGTCSACNTNNDCDVNADDICSNDRCEMRPLSHATSATEIMTPVLIFIGSFIAAGGGLGGGVIFVPCFILFLGFDVRSSAALSQATIFGGSLVNLYMNSKIPHPVRKHRPLTDYNTLLILEPMLLGGTIIGVVLNRIMPAVAILSILVVVLVIAVVRMLRKAVAQFKAESLAAETAASAMVEMDPVKTISIDDTSAICNLARQVGCEPAAVAKLSQQQQLQLAECVEVESQIMQPMLWIAVVWLVASLFSMLRTPLIVDVPACSLAYFLVLFGVYPGLVAVSFYISRKNMREYKQKTELGWTPANGDITWTGRKAVVYPILAGVAGLLGGLLGIGGGMIVGPMLIELGLIPRVAAACCALAVGVTASSAAFQFVLLHMLRYDFMALYMAIGIVGTIFGQTVVNYVINKYGRNSIVVFAVAAVILVAIGLILANMAITLSNGGWSLSIINIC